MYTRSHAAHVIGVNFHHTLFISNYLTLYNYYESTNALLQICLFEVVVFVGRIRTILINQTYMNN